MIKKQQPLNKIIKDRGLKKIYIAYEMGITAETLSKKLKKPETFDGRQMARIAELLGVQIIDIDFNIPFFSK